MTKSIVYYTDNKLDGQIESVVREYILKAQLPVVSCSLKPIDFGKNIVLDREPSFVTYMTQIKTALENSDSDYVFFCEHDVLYPKSHFYFTPPRDDIFYYNENVYRWRFGADFAITYDHLISLSGLCCNRKLALDHYKLRLEKASTMPIESNIREPSWARKWGYEPGTKRPGNGGFSDLAYETWMSELPIVDIRHPGTISKEKVTLDSFKNPPMNWQQINVNEIPGWNVRELFV
jgi:hypothetical protein